MATKSLDALFLAIAVLVTVFAATMLPRPLGAQLVGLQLLLGAYWVLRLWWGRR